jgi:cellulose biosynthesis protein BcsQ
MFKIVFFNHKGGVSKTTTTYHLGWMLAILGKKVLVVDGDPQCNLTSLILGDDFDDYYTQDATKNQNIKDGVKVAFEGKPYPIEAVTCRNPSNNSNLFLLAGHPNLSEYDASLSFAQTSNNALTTLMNLPGAFNELITKTCEKYEIDIVLIDLNPGLSAINQNLFTLCDAFIIPTNPDPFCIMAIKSLATVLPRWVKWTDNMRNVYFEAGATYQLSNSRPRFIGEIIQRYNIRKGSAARPFQGSINEIKQVVSQTFVPAMKQNNMLFDDELYKSANIPIDYCFAEIPDFQSILQKANEAGVPLFTLTDSQLNVTGPVLDGPNGLKVKRQEFYDLFLRLANQIITIVEYAANPQSVLV